jgi:hypothetical protein
MITRRGLTTAVVATGLALVFASPARADDFSGTYSLSLRGAPGEGTSWTAHSTCQPSGSCVAHITSSTGWGADAQLAGDRWTMMVARPDGQSCPDGTRHAELQIWTWDAATLSGLVSGVSTDHSACKMGPADSFALKAVG